MQQEALLKNSELDRLLPSQCTRFSLKLLKCVLASQGVTTRFSAAHFASFPVSPRVFPHLRIFSTSHPASFCDSPGVFPRLTRRLSASPHLFRVSPGVFRRLVSRLSSTHLAQCAAPWSAAGRSLRRRARGCRARRPPC